MGLLSGSKFGELQSVLFFVEKTASLSNPSCATQEIYPGDSREQMSVWLSPAGGVCENPRCSGIPKKKGRRFSPGA